jgi:prepilin-type N-terminal cleavage/methylation domain-containing protein
MNMKSPSSLALATPRGGRGPAVRQNRFRVGRLGELNASRGLTLIELLIAVAIAGILLSVALPSYQAQVVVVDKVIDAASGTLGVRLQLANPDNKIPAGIQCGVVFGK